MSPDIYFGIIDQFDFEKHYDQDNQGNYNFLEILAKYHCIGIPYDIVNEWVNGLMHIPTHWHWYGREAKGLAQFGVTLLPPSSLNDFIRIIQEYVIASSAGKKKRRKINRLIRLLNQAISENKWVIHYGL